MTVGAAGTWRALAHGWPVFVPVIMVEAGVQALLVLSDPVPEWSAGFLVLLLVSLLALLAAVWLTVGAASAAVDGTGGGLRRAWRRPVSWRGRWPSASSPPPLVAPALATPSCCSSGRSCCPRPPSMIGEPVGRAYRPVVRTPARWALAVLGAVVLAVVTWIVALSFGFFVTGVLGAVSRGRGRRGGDVALGLPPPPGCRRRRRGPKACA